MSDDPKPTAPFSEALRNWKPVTSGPRSSFEALRNLAPPTRDPETEKNSLEQLISPPPQPWWLHQLQQFVQQLQQQTQPETEQEAQKLKYLMICAIVKSLKRGKVEKVTEDLVRQIKAKWADECKKHSIPPTGYFDPRTINRWVVGRALGLLPRASRK